MNSFAKILMNSAALLALCVVGGCATEPSVSEQNFGNSVRNMVRAQTYDASTLDGGASDSVADGDGQRIEGVLDTYREAPSQPTNVGQEVSISVGGQ